MLSTYKRILFSLPPIYIAKKATIKAGDTEEYASLLIDKFALQSSTFYHITNGFIESTHSSKKLVLMGFDIFSFNSIFRDLIETYLAFHGLFIGSKETDEKRTKFLLWKIQGLVSKGKLFFDDDNNNKILNEDKSMIKSLEDELYENPFFKSLERKEIGKIYRKDEKYNWRFRVVDNKVESYNNLDYSYLICKSTVIKNLYKLTSMHIHSGYYSIEQFKNVRGVIVDDKYINSYLVQASYLMSCLIKDLVETCEGSKKAFEKLGSDDKYVIDTTYSILGSMNQDVAKENN